MTSKKMEHQTPVRLSLVARCAEIASSFARNTAGVRSVTFSTADGLPVASTLTSTQEVDKMSALSGSIAALASALTREAGHGGPDRVILESQDGQIVSMRVDAAHADLVLTVVTDKNAVLGKVLWSCRAAAEQAAAPDPGVRAPAQAGA